MNKKLKRVCTVAFSALTVGACASIADMEVTKRLAMHAGDYWTVNWDEETQESQFPNPLVERIPDGSRVVFAVADKSLSVTPSDGSAEFRLRFRLVSDLMASLSWTTVAGPKSKGVWPAAEPCPGTPDEKLTWCAKYNPDPMSPAPQLVAWYGDPAGADGLCVLGVIKMDSRDTDRDTVELRPLHCPGGPVTGGALIGGPRPSVRYPIREVARVPNSGQQP